MDPCNGIFCLIGSPNALIPSLRQFLPLPKSHHRESPGDMNDFNEHYGFGFDPNTNDYKLIVLRDFVLDDSDESGNEGDYVLAFDMVNELFRKIKVPKVVYSLHDCSKTLVPFNESRGLDNWFHFDVWVMKDYFNEGSWILQYSVGPVPVAYYLVGFYGSDQFLWRDDNERLVLYEAVNDNTR
ncbi:uncharacterized protein LOC123895674 [Trifolium pratense]|uniref:uncharacterized protein LOC123895674 n=1 Tax=Trifolium pratense TaxID=57577 RepID=UPI001E696C64|nr:uncharacterized protein LOC123895674 [Trifolium pratense]